MNELVRIVADWLEDGTNGVNAQLALVPRDGGDPQPVNVLVYDETRDNRPARGRVPEGAAELPAITVALQGLTHLTEQVTDDGYLAAEIVVQYAAKNVDAWKAKRDGNYTLRAAAWSLRKLRRTDGNAAARLRNSVALIGIDPVRFDPWFERVDDTLVVGTLTVPVTARDFGI
jgi:hypothetical protein